MHLNLFLFLITFLCFSSSNFAFNRKIIYLKIEKNSKENNINLILFHNSKDIDLKKDITYREYKLKNPTRNVIDIFYDNGKYELKLTENKKEKTEIKNFVIKDVKNLRNAYHNFGFRVVLDLNENNKIKKDIVTKVNNISLNKENIKKNNIVITIDPGHGGKDSGAVRKFNKKIIKEKDLTLKYSIALKKELELRNFKVFLTRDKDKFLPLEKRVLVARENLSNLMISIHIDEAPNKNFYGTTIYAIDDIDLNHQDWFRFHNFNYTPLNILQKKRNISEIIINLMHKETKMNSDYIANEIMHSLLLENTIKRCYKKSQSFAVLRATDMPTILIEIGYLSNENEIKKIIDERYMIEFVKSLSNSITKLYAQ